MEEIKYLLLTIFVESLVANLLLREIDWRKVLLVTISVNLISHPIAWFLVLHGKSWWVVEGLVFVFEAIIFYLLFPSVRIKAASTAIVMNAASAIAGLIVARL